MKREYLRDKPKEVLAVRTEPYGKNNTGSKFLVGLSENFKVKLLVRVKVIARVCWRLLNLVISN